MSQETCQNSTTYRYTWPGRDESFICEEHARRYRAVADAMGLYLQLVSIHGNLGITCKHKISGNSINLDGAEMYNAMVIAWEASCGAPAPDVVERVARAICKSCTCEGVSCCQWPANRGRLQCPVRDGVYDDAARAAISERAPDLPQPGNVSSWVCPITGNTKCREKLCSNTHYFLRDSCGYKLRAPEKTPRPAMPPPEHSERTPVEVEPSAWAQEEAQRVIALHTSGNPDGTVWWTAGTFAETVKGLSADFACALDATRRESSPALTRALDALDIAVTALAVEQQLGARGSGARVGVAMARILGAVPLAGSGR